MSALERDLEILFYFLIFTEFVLLYCFCFMFWFFGPKAHGIFVPNQGLDLHPLNWKVKS